MNAVHCWHKNKNVFKSKNVAISYNFKITRGRYFCCSYDELTAITH